MAAFWNIVLPYEIHFEDKPENQKFFDAKYADNFKYTQTRKFETVREGTGNGTTRIFEHSEKQYILDSELIKSEFEPFFLDTVKEFENQYEKNPSCGFESKFFYKKQFTEFLTEFKKKPFENINNEHIEFIKGIKNNSYIFFDKLFSMIVFEGFAFPNDFTVYGISFLSSHDPMNMIPQETLAFHNFTNFIVENFSKKYKLAKYIFNAGY